MNIKMMAKELQEGLREGTLNFVIWKEGRSWNCDTFRSYNDDKDPEEEARLTDIRNNIDAKAIVVNGYKNFADYSLKFIEYQIKNIYNAERTEVEEAAAQEVEIPVTGVVYTMMLTAGMELIEGEEIRLVERYEPEYEGQGYDIIDVKATEPLGVVYLDSEGNLYKASTVEDGHITSWDYAGPRLRVTETVADKLRNSFHRFFGKLRSGQQV